MYIYLFGIIHGISMEHFFGIQYEDTTKPTTKKRPCQSDSGSAQVGFDRPLIPVLIDSLRNKKTQNLQSWTRCVSWTHSLVEGPINRKKGPKRPSSEKHFPVDKNLTTLAAVEIPSISRGKVESSEFWVDACGCCFVAPWSCTRIFLVILDDMCSIYICIHLCV